MKAGIVGYGVYVPTYRIKTSEIAAVWGEETARIEKGLGILEKAVGGVDEDAATLAVEASRHAVSRAQIDPRQIGAVYIGSESHPYAVKPTATIVAEAIGSVPETTAADLEFACKAGTAGIQMVCGMVLAGQIKYGLAVGSDTAQGRPGDALEYSAGSGAAAYIIGSEKESIATIDATYSYTTDTPDFWRRQGSSYPSHGGRFTGDPAYFRHVRAATEGILKKVNMKATEFDHVVFHQPNAKFPLQLGKEMGIPPEKMKGGLLTPHIGNTYSGASIIGLANILDEAKAEDKILCVSYGSGAGSDAFVITVTDRIESKRNLAPLLKTYVAKKQYITYPTYMKFRRKIKT